MQPTLTNIQDKFGQIMKMMIKNIDELSTCDWFPMPIHIKLKNLSVHPLQLHRENSNPVFLLFNTQGWRTKSIGPKKVSAWELIPPTEDR